MQYKVYFINRAFKDVLNREILLNIINKEKDEYQKKQVKHLLNEVSFETILCDAKDYFKDREDVIYANSEIIIANCITKEISRIIISEGDLYVVVNREDDILITFLNAKYRPLILEPTPIKVSTVIV